MRRRSREVKQKHTAGAAAGKLVFVPLPPPTDDDIARLAHRIARRLSKLATRYLVERDEEYIDPDDEQAALLHALSTALRPPVRPQPTLPLGGPELHPALYEWLL